MVQVRTGRIYQFDGFQLDADARRLFHHGEPVALHGKALEMLLVLVRHRGQLLTKDQLFKMVWPDQIVEESNLTVNMSAIRRALGEQANSPRYITTVSGRGYRFTDNVRETVGADEVLTVESETFTRVVVEQGEETDPAVAGATNIIPAVGLPRGSDEALTAVGDGSATAIASDLAAHNEEARLRRRARVIKSVLGGLFLLAVAAGAILFYRSRTQPRQTVASTPPPQITARCFTTAGGVPYRVGLSPDGKSLGYLQRINGKHSLWLGQIETNSNVQISQPNSWYGFGSGFPVFAPDGNSIYFSVQDEHHPRPTLLRMPVVGGAFTELIQNVDSPITFSPDGRQLAFIREGPEINQNSIVIADADGKRERALITRRAPERFSGQGLSWSPDGKTIAVATGRADNKREELLAMSVADGSLSKIGSRDWGNVGNLVWLPDASGVVMVAQENVTPGGYGQIWLVTYPGGVARKLTDEVNYYQMEFLSMSADGKLAAMRAHTSSESDSSVDNQVSVTADGRYLVFHSNRSSSSEIWRANRDGSDLKQITYGGGNSQPTLSPDGQWIVYTSERDSKQTLWRVSINGGEAMQLTARRLSWPEVSPDGKWIACMDPTTLARWRLTVIPFAGGEPVKSFAVPRSARLERRLRWTPDGKAIMYQDSYHGLWRQALEEEEPRLVEAFEEVRVFQFTRSLDGKNLAHTTGVEMREIILIENFR